MKAGRLRTKLDVFELVNGSDRFGSAQSSYREVGTIHAERVQLDGRRSEEVGEHFPDYTATFRVRIAHKLKENWRVKDYDSGYTFTIESIILNKQRGFQTLRCARLNP
jgi:head-tail adaptor